MHEGFRNERRSYIAQADSLLDTDKVNEAISYFLMAVMAKEANLSDIFDRLSKKRTAQAREGGESPGMGNAVAFFSRLAIDAMLPDDNRHKLKFWPIQETLAAALTALRVRDIYVAAQLFAKVNWLAIKTPYPASARNAYYHMLIALQNHDKVREAMGDFLTEGNKSLDPTPRLGEDWLVDSETFNELNEDLLKDYQSVMDDHTEGLKVVKAFLADYAKNGQTDKLPALYRLRSDFLERVIKILTIFATRLPSDDSGLAQQYRDLAATYEKDRAESLASAEEFASGNPKAEGKKAAAVAPKTEASPTIADKPSASSSSSSASREQVVAVDVKSTPKVTNSSQPTAVLQSTQPVSTAQPKSENHSRSGVGTSSSLFKREAPRDEDLGIDRRLAGLLSAAVTQYKKQNKKPEQAADRNKADAFIVTLRNQNLLEALKGVPENSSLSASIGQALIEYFVDRPAERVKTDPNKFIAELVEELQAATKPIRS